MSDAVRIEQRLHDLFVSWRRKQGPQHPKRESPREMEARAVERLYGQRSTTVVRAEPQTDRRGD